MTKWFEQGLTTLAFIWRVERGDGVAIGFTSHDRDLVRDGLAYRAAPGMAPSAIERSDGFEGDDVALSGALTDAAFREPDLLSGRWDGAALTLAAVDWSDAGAEPVVLARGTFGAVEVREGAFSVSLRGDGAVFDRAVVEATSPECRAELGDRRCRVDLAARRVVASVATGEDTVLTMQVAPDADGSFAGGRLRWLDGANAGLQARIVVQVGAEVTVQDAPFFPVVAGDRAELTHGCDKSFATCRARFANSANFRGEPHLPGNDVLTRYGE